MLQLAVVALPPGPCAQLPLADHHISVHVGAPVRVSRPASGVRGVRERGFVDITPAGLVEDGWFIDDPAESIDVRIPAALITAAADELGLDSRVEIAARCHAPDPQVAHIVWALEAEQRADAPSGLVYRESLGMALAVHLLSRYRTALPPRGGLSAAQLARVTEYIDAHVDRDLSLHRLARVAGVSAPHLSALFKRSVGETVHAFVIRRRVERARTLLLGGGTPAQVALDAGFAHQSHMARCMRRVLGVTPSQLTR